MKFILKLFMLLSAIVFAVIAVIKVIEGCSWKEAVGIAEELWNELTEPFRYCCAHDSEESEDGE